VASRRRSGVYYSLRVRPAYLAISRPLDPVLAGVVGGVAVAGLEIAAVGGGVFLAATLIALFASVGAVIGAVLALTGWWVDRRDWSGWRAAFAHALPTVLVLVPVARSLFDGAFAQTLPGAQVAPFVLPLVGLAGIAVAIRLGCAWYGDASVARRASLVVALVSAVVVVAWVNRTVHRSGYPDVHAALTVVALVLATIAVRVPLGLGDLPGLGRVALGLALVAAAVPAFAWGLGSANDRRDLASSDDARHLVRILRAFVDLDGDGHARVLGGGDCDDRSSARHPGARDLPGNGVDEDCDGSDAIAARAPALERAASDAAAALAARTRDMNIVLVSVDTLRADLLAAGAPARADLPRVAALLDGSVSFPRAFAPAAGTDLAVATLLTGRVDPFQRVPTTLLEALRASGRLTHAILPREVLRYAGETLITRGLDSVDRVVTDGKTRDVGDTVSAGVTTDRALGFLDRVGDHPFALWAHYFDVHEHRQLAVPPEMLAAVPDRGDGELGRRYRALARHVDTEIGRLLDELDRRGLADRTIVVFLSDHGESLGEDDRLPDNHGLVVYGALTRIPLAFRVPGVAAAEALEPVGILDVAPTLLALVGATGAMTEVDGIALVEDLAGTGPARRDRVLAINEQEQWGVVDWPWKLIVRPSDNLVELYRIDSDPAEKTDLAAAEPERVRTLRARYGQLPAVSLDRSAAGRQWRERQARPLRPR
jgi:arylsulfatase A-like enzyme